MTETIRAGVNAATVTEYLSNDHRRLDALFGEAIALARRGASAEAAGRAAEFRAGLERHIRWEEEILFPIFEDRTGSSMGPTSVMRAEHRELLALLQGWSGAAPAQVSETLQRTADAIAELLGQHNMKEEQVLYPRTDAFLDAAGRADAVRRMEGMR